MEWLQKELESGLDVMICHPQLVETGVDMLDFPTIIWYEADYNTARVRQASRRSWRIGQTAPVRIYYLTYENSKQTQAIYLIAQKVATSLAVEGDLSTDGLTAMAGGDNMGRSIAQLLVDGDGDFEGSFEAGINIAGFQEDSDGERMLVGDEDDWDVEQDEEDADGLTDEMAWSLVSDVIVSSDGDGEQGALTAQPELGDEIDVLPLFDSVEVDEVDSAVDDSVDDGLPNPSDYGAVSLDNWLNAFDLTTEDLERGKVKRKRRGKAVKPTPMVELH